MNFDKKKISFFSIYVSTLCAFAIFIGASCSSALSIVAPSLAYAQTAQPSSVDGIDIKAEPATPAPGQTVTVSLTSFITDINRALITWRVDGKVLSKGNGITKLNINAPSNGGSMTILVTVDTVEGAEVKKIITIKSGDVDLVLETSGYAPVFYRGRIPFVFQNNIRVVAIPHLVDKSGQIDPKNLSYTWKKNGEVFANLSGFGRQSFDFKVPLGSSPITFEVNVTSKDGSVRGSAEQTYTPDAPSISFYEDSPLYGIMYNKAVSDTLDIVHNEAKVVAVPYGFDVTAPSVTPPSPVYTWSVDNTTHDELSKSRFIALARSAGSQVSSNINLSIANIGEEILQHAEKSFFVQSTANTDSSSTQNNVTF